jgi:peptidoglycan-associated lipoprotein
MNNKCLAPLLVLLTLTLAACQSDKKGDYTGMGGDNGDNLPGDKLDMNSGGIPPSRGNFNPDTDVDYNALKSSTVYFAFDASTIPRSEQGKLSAVQQWLAANPDHQLYLAGHADKRGTPEYNRALGERRALAVREYLVGLGLKPDDLYTNSYGSDRPAVDGETAEAYAKNRRVEVGVIVRK